MLRPVFAAFAALALGTAAFAQTTTSAALSPSTQQVQLVAPQLVAFAGSTGNFESLVSGLTTGAAVTLTSVGADGSLQIVTFTPVTAVSPGDAARLLETARQNLISRGIAAPTGTQLAASLMGGTISTASGTSALTGVLTGTTSSPTPVAVRNDSVALQNGAANSSISPAQLAAVRNALATGTGVTLNMGSGATTQNVVFSPTGVRLSDFEVNQALQLAGTLLAQQGVLNPTADQLRVALFGGTLVGTNGATFPLQGVLQGQLTNTSNSSLTGTSNSPAASTSSSPVAGTSNSPFATTPGASSAGGTTTTAPLVPRGAAAPARR
ncbi:MAG: hypothetical protein ACJ8G5_14130 [Burkholderiales bacterium]